MDIGISSFVRDVPLKIRGIPAWPFPPDNGQHPFGGIGQLPTSFCWKHEAQDAQALAADFGDDASFDGIADQQVIAGRAAVASMGGSEQGQVVQVGAIELLVAAPGGVPQ